MPPLAFSVCLVKSKCLPLYNTALYCGSCTLKLITRQLEICRLQCRVIHRTCLQSLTCGPTVQQPLGILVDFFKGLVHRKMPIQSDENQSETNVSQVIIILFSKPSLLISELILEFLLHICTYLKDSSKNYDFMIYKHRM